MNWPLRRRAWRRGAAKSPSSSSRAPSWGGLAQLENMPPSWVGALAQLENMEKENHDAAMVAKSRSRIRGHEEEVRAPWYLFGLGSLLTHRLFLDSIVVSIPACHAGDRGSIPRRGGPRP